MSSFSPRRSNTHNSRSGEEDDDFCVKCEEQIWNIQCSCRQRYCDSCFTKHLKKHPKHWKAGFKASEDRWNRITRVISGLSGLLSGNSTTVFSKDEDAKWFGLHVPAKIGGRDQDPAIVETPRLELLIEQSINQNQGPRLQYPSICCFVGDTGAGKSTLSEHPSLFPEYRPSMLCLHQLSLTDI